MGQLQFFASYLDPTSGDLGEIMPGDLLAKDLNDNVVILETYGMVAVELEGSNGEALNVASGESVQLSMPVSTVQQSNAPNTIPLWYFDEIDGNWIEDGIATLQGSSYIGEVSHFSYWNCDDPYSTVPFGATFGCNSLPIPNLPVSMFDANTDILFGVSYTNSLGQITDPIPANIELDMVIHDQCGNEIFSQNIGVNSSALNLGFVSLCSQASPVAFTGVLQDCNSQPIENGLVNVNIDGGSSTLYSDANGVVNGIIVSCSQNDMVITAYDFQNGMQSLTSVVPFNSSYDAGVINVCDTVDEFVEYTFEGNTYFYTDLGQNEVDLTKSVVGDTLRLFATEQINTNVLISFCVIANSTGTYPNLGWPYVWHVSSLLVWPPGQNVSAGENSIMVNITQFPPNVGDYIEGTFSGAFIDIGSIPRSITGSFRIMRSF
ncbi:hypothetical protein N9Y60_01955 [Crocinitomicaceae bacterium]|nr:hypothetical protein [Crocinitomicaceae bacterium]